ncbi:hypothetical protein [Halobellus limi]|uniref:Uncharacterized protein n=1 Tax=Halobellus limi TaxID=699433 RepID=A0A4D6H5G9_9EURY|nr:hypothetical protein [Halobellus limi]QCC48087.1 hypothetical protein DV707_10685 [Halobellus limi]
MNKSEVLVEILAELRPQVSIPVDTEGIDGPREIPRVTLGSVSVRRVPDGHQNYVGVETDGSGRETGTVHHLVWRATVDTVVVTPDEVERDDVLDLIGSAFAIHEDLPHEWHPDVRLIEVGAESPRSLPFQEPDLFSGGRTLTFEYVQEVTKSGNTLTAVTEAVDPTLTISETVE